MKVASSAAVLPTAVECTGVQKTDTRPREICSSERAMVGNQEWPSEAWLFYRGTACCRSQPSVRVHPTFGPARSAALLGNRTNSQSCQGPVWYLQQDVQVALLWNQPLVARRILASGCNRVGRVPIAKVPERFSPRFSTRMDFHCRSFRLEWAEASTCFALKKLGSGPRLNAVISQLAQSNQQLCLPGAETWTPSSNEMLQIEL